MTDIVFLYVTAPNTETAARIGRTLVEEKLAACVNIHGEMRSLYNWQGKVEVHLETPMIVKTNAGVAEATCTRIVTLHPHETPCVIALPVTASGSHQPFIDWIDEAVQA